MTIDQIERLHDLARRDRQRFEGLERQSDRIPSVTDPIEAEVLRCRNALYCTLAAGVIDVEVAFQTHYERAKAACEHYNKAQERRIGKKSWHDTHTGYFSPDEAWQRLRHAVRMYKAICNDQT